MARKYERKPGHYAWNLEKCEEEIIINGYEEILRFIPSHQTWKVLFEANFYSHGNGIAFEDLEAINLVRRRRGFPVIVIRETDVYEYGRTPDKPLRSKQRLHVKEWFGDATQEDRQIG